MDMMWYDCFQALVLLSRIVKHVSSSSLPTITIIVINLTHPFGTGLAPEPRLLILQMSVGEV